MSLLKMSEPVEKSANSSNTKFSQVIWEEKPEYEIGKGSFGVVYSGKVPEYRGTRTRRRETQVAVKVLHRPPVTAKEQQDFVREVETSKKFSHPALTNFICCVMGKSYKIVTERCVKDLEKVIQESERGISPSWTNKDDETVEWNETKKTICALGVAIGLYVIHKANVIHRDLKTENIMLDENMYPKISDFGLSRTIPYGAEESNKMIEMTMDRGTPLYMAPEMFDESFGGYNQKIDVYSYGMFLYELATGAKPFKEKGELNKFNLRRYIIEGQRPTIPDYVNPMWADIMTQCWDPSPHQRPTMEEVVKGIEADLNGFMLDGCDVNEVEDYMSEVLAAIDK